MPLFILRIAKLSLPLLFGMSLIKLFTPLSLNATEVNLNQSLDSYPAQDGIRNSFFLSDIAPGDWAHKSLQTLSSDCRCTNAINGQALTRYEAAAIVNSCVQKLVANRKDLIHQDELSRLINEFESEMIILKARL